MTEATADSKLTIVAEPPDAGPAAIRTAVIFWCVAIAIVIGDIAWVGFSAAVAINSRDFNPLPLFGVLCAGLLGTVTLISGMLHTLRFRKFGSSVLTVSEPRLGEQLKGNVRTEHDLAVLGDFKARLRCDMHTSMRSSRGGRTSGLNCLWESVQSAPASAHSGAGIPIDIAIPGDGLASGPRKTGSDTDARVTWALEIRAPLSGLDYYTEFAIPMNGRRRGGEESGGVEAPKGGSAGSGPFSGRDAPRSQRWKWLLRGLVMFGAMVTVAGTFGVVDELRSARVTGHVTDFKSTTLDVAIDGSGSPPVTAHVTHFPKSQHWEPGMAITLICGEVKEGTYSCDADTGLRWWIQTAIGMGVGLGMLLLATVLWRRRRWWA
jgi:hypothetical protein